LVVIRKNNSIQFIYCKCGCGFTTWKYDSRNRERHYIKGHSWLGRKHSEETKNKISCVKKGHKRTIESIRKQLESRKGFKHSQETKLKISKSHIGKTVGKNNGFWIGDKVKYAGLHQWIRRHLPKPKLCEMCNLIAPTDLANITGIYTRDFNNWKYFCHKCHMNFDKIYERNFKPYIESIRKKQ
jgi:hypothetical protein